MAKAETNSGSTVWIAVIIGLVVLAIVGGYALMQRVELVPGDFRWEAPSTPAGPKVPDAPRLPGRVN